MTEPLSGGGKAGGLVSDLTAKSSTTPSREDRAQNSAVESDHPKSSPLTSENPAAEVSESALNDVYEVEHGKGSPKRDNEALFIAARDCNREEVLKLLKEGVDINAKIEPLGAALHAASHSGHDSVIEVLLEKGADTETKDSDERSPLLIASFLGYSNIVRRFLDHGVAVDSQGPFGLTPLMAALRQGNGQNQENDTYGEIAQMLLKEGAKVNCAASDGSTPLQLAAKFGTLERVRLILEYNADVNRADKTGWTPLHRALQNDNENDREPIARLLLEHGAETLATHRDRETPLHLACKGSSVGMTRLLLEYNTQVDATDRNGWTALHLASSKGHGNVVQLLLEAGANSERKTGDTNQTALILAIISSTDTNGTDTETGQKDWKENRRKSLESLAQKADLDGIKLALSKVSMQEDLEVLTGITIANSVEKSELKKMKLKWCAERADKHGVVCDMLKVDHIKIALKPCSALQWAAYHGNTHLVWWLLKTAKPSKDTDDDRRKAKEIAKKMKERGVAKSMKARETADSRRAKVVVESGMAEMRSGSIVKDSRIDSKKGIGAARYMKDGSNSTYKAQLHENDAMTQLIQNALKAKGDKESGYFLTLDMLEDPPPVEGLAESDMCYEYPFLNKAFEGVVDGYEATIVDFYRRNRHVNFVRRSRKLFSVIYDDKLGVEKIMDSARETLKKISLEAAEEKSYSSDDLQLRWIHLPANNIEWMQDLVKRICLDEGRTKDEYLSLRDFFQRSWLELPTGSSKTKYMKPTCLKEESPKRKHKTENEASRTSKQRPLRLRNETQGSNSLKPSSSSTTSGESEKGSKKDIASSSSNILGEKSTANNKEDETCIERDVYEKVALYMPYITFGICFPERVQVQSRDKYEHLLKAYNGKVIHGSRSLDQFYYHSLPSMSDRDRGQVATRYLTKDERQGSGQWSVQNPSGWPFLRVDQLWLWVIDERTIVTSSTHRPDGLQDPVVEIIFNYLRTEKGKGQGQPPPSTVDEMSRFIVNFCVNFINQADWDKTSERSVQQIFADTINEVAVKEASLFQDFTEKVRRKRDESKGIKEESQEKVKDTLASKNANQESPKDAEDSLETEDWESISRAASLLEEVKDIRDELNILRTLLAQQSSVWKELLGPNSEDSGPADTTKDITEMSEQSTAIQSAVNDILNLEQNGINITEAVLSRRQGRTLMVFTIVTIIFLPLSFLASLFALNVSIFQHDHQGNLSYQPGWIFPIILCISTGVSVPLILSAFYVENMTRVLQKLFTKPKPPKQGRLSQPIAGDAGAHHISEKEKIEESEKADGELVRSVGRTDTGKNAAADTDGPEVRLDTGKVRLFPRLRRLHPNWNAPIKDDDKV